MKLIILISILFVLLPLWANAEPLTIRAIGESTSVGHYDNQDHPNDLNACIPLMVQQAVLDKGIPCILENKAVSSVTVDWVLGRKDGDESIWEPELLVDPPGTVKSLLNSPAQVVTVQLGINDTLSNDPISFYFDFKELIDNCKRCGKVVFIALPNSINNGVPLYYKRLATNVIFMKEIADIKKVICADSGIKTVDMNDAYHPNPGSEGYEKLGEDLKAVVSFYASDILTASMVSRYYVAMFNRPPEVEGLYFWINECNNNDRNIVADMVVYATEDNEARKMTNAEFIQRIYQNLLSRMPDPEGMAYWLDRIYMSSRGSVLNELIDYLIYSAPDNSPDKKILQNKTFAAMAYGFVYKKTAVAPYGCLNGVTTDPTTIYTFTQTL